MKHLIALASIVVSIGCNVSDSGGGLTPDPEPEVTCEADTCNGNGECSVVDDAILCECDAGYSGAACDGCAAGFQDNDADGSCQASCASTELMCGDNGSCTDVSGTVTCECDTGHVGDLCDMCEAGFQDQDSDGTCLPTCETAALECGSGNCEDASGEPACVCPTGYAGVGCGACAEGYQDNDGDGVCTEGCSLVDLGCPNQQQCDDSSGTPTCECGPGDPCVTCEDGLQDEDGNGACVASCGPEDADRTWWNPAFRNRLPLSVTPDVDRIEGAIMMVSFDHATEVDAGRSLESGDDVRVVQVQSDGTFVELSRIVDGPAWNVDELRVAFELANPAAANTRIPGLWLYWNNEGAGAPPTFTPPDRPETLVAIDDPTHSLLCDYRSSTFYSIQLRHEAANSNLFQIVVRDRTADPNAYGRVIVTDTAGNEILRRNYGELGGGCCDPNDAEERAESVTISQREFTVTLQSGEFSTSHRYFGCRRFGTGNPAYDGSDRISYRRGPVPYASGAVCERGVPDPVM